MLRDMNCLRIMTCRSSDGAMCCEGRMKKLIAWFPSLFFVLAGMPGAEIRVTGEAVLECSGTDETTPSGEKLEFSVLT
jgi:hypothetical protein